MDRRKDTVQKLVKLPRDYMDMVEEVFNKNFSKQLRTEKGKKEKFLVYAEMYSDEVVLAVSLLHPDTQRAQTCYASVDFPPPGSAEKKGVSEQVQIAVSLAVDAVASFFQTYFDEGRPVDYDSEYRQEWTKVELEKNKPVFVRINRDNLDLEAQADAFLEMHDKGKKKKSDLH